jgi:hypothetical protein
VKDLDAFASSIEGLVQFAITLVEFCSRLQEDVFRINEVIDQRLFVGRKAFPDSAKFGQERGGGPEITSPTHAPNL